MNGHTTRQAVWAVAGVFALFLAITMVGAAASAAEPAEEPRVEAQQQVEPDGGWGGGRGMRAGGGCCGHCGGDTQAGGCCGGGRAKPGGAGIGRHGAAGHRPEMRNAHALIAAHSAIERWVEELPNGTRTETTVEDAELVSVLQRHVAEMAALIESGGRIRNWDPLFSTIFDHHEAIQMEIENIPNGVVVTETSDDPRVAALIRAHAAKVDEFVARGAAACRESTALPEDFLASGEPIEMELPCWTGVG